MQQKVSKWFQGFWVISWAFYFPFLSVFRWLLKKSSGSWGWGLLACWDTASDSPWALVLVESWKESSLVVIAYGEFIYLSMTNDSWRANGGRNPGLSKAQLPKHSLEENDLSLWHCGEWFVVMSSDLSLLSLTPLP